MRISWSSCRLASLAASLAIACFFAVSVIAERVTIAPGRSFCFFEDLKKGSNFGVQFQVDENDIRVVINGPGEVVYDGAAETYGSYTFVTKSDGRYVVCLDNTRSSNGAKKVSFNILGAPAEAAATGKLEPAQVELRELNSGLRGIRDEQENMMQREVKHRQTAENTNSRVMWWFFIQVGILGSVCYWQIYYLKRFFETRRVV